MLHAVSGEVRLPGGTAPVAIASPTTHGRNCRQAEDTGGNTDSWHSLGWKGPYRSSCPQAGHLPVTCVAQSSLPPSLGHFHGGIGVDKGSDSFSLAAKERCVSTGNKQLWSIAAESHWTAETHIQLLLSENKKKGKAVFVWKGVNILRLRGSFSQQFQFCFIATDSRIRKKQAMFVNKQAWPCWQASFSFIRSWYIWKIPPLLPTTPVRRDQGLQQAPAHSERNQSFAEKWNLSYHQFLGWLHQLRFRFPKNDFMWKCIGKQGGPGPVPQHLDVSSTLPVLGSPWWAMCEGGGTEQHHLLYCSYLN